MMTRVVFQLFLVVFLVSQAAFGLIAGLNATDSATVEHYYQNPTIVPDPIHPPSSYNANVQAHILRIFQDPFYSGKKMATVGANAPFPYVMRRHVLETYANYIVNRRYPPKPEGETTNYPHQYAYAIIAAFRDPDAEFRAFAMRQFRKVIPVLDKLNASVTELHVATELDKVLQSVRIRATKPDSRAAAYPAYLMLLKADAAAPLLAQFEHTREANETLRLAVLEALTVDSVTQKRGHPDLQVAALRFLLDPASVVREQVRKLVGPTRYGRLQEDEGIKDTNLLSAPANALLAEFFDPKKYRQIQPYTLAAAARVIGLDNYHRYGSHDSLSPDLNRALIKALAHNDLSVVSAACWAYTMIKPSDADSQIALLKVLENQTDWEVRNLALAALGRNDSHPAGHMKTDAAREALFAVLPRVISGEVSDADDQLLTGLAYLAHKNQPTTTGQYANAVAAQVALTSSNADGGVIQDMRRALGRVEERGLRIVPETRSDEARRLVRMAPNAQSVDLLTVLARIAPTAADLFPAGASYPTASLDLIATYLRQLTDGDLETFLTAADAEPAILRVLRSKNNQVRRALLWRLVNRPRKNNTIRDPFRLETSAAIYTEIAKLMIYDDTTHAEEATKIGRLACEVIRDKVKTRGRWDLLPLQDVAFIRVIDSYGEREDLAGAVAREMFAMMHRNRRQLAAMDPPCPEAIITTLNEYHSPRPARRAATPAPDAAAAE